MTEGVAHLSLIERSTNAETDGALVTAAREGNEAAFEHLYVRYRRMVHAIALARVPPADAEDVVQEVFVLAMRNLARLREAAAFGGWLAAIAKRQASGWRRNTPDHSELTETAVASTQENDEDARKVLATIQTLPIAYRETLLMRLVEGMTGPEIAAQTGLTPDSVRVNLHRGMRLLRAALENPR